MTFKRAVCASTLAAGVGLAGLFGVGLGTASADPGQCNMPGQPACGQDQHGNGDGRGGDNGNNNGRGGGNGNGNGNGYDNGRGNDNGNRGWNDNGNNGAPADWQGRGVDQGRNDHQPFNWNGQQVTPMPAGNGAGWGFWFLGIWIPL